MHVRVRLLGQSDAIVVVESKLTKIEKFRRILQDKFDVKPNLQRLFYGGKLLENGYTFHDYNIKLNDVIQFMVRVQESPEKETEAKTSNNEKKDINKLEYQDAESVLFKIGDFVDVRDKEQGAWFEGKILRIVHDPNSPPDIGSSNDQEVDKQDKENEPEHKLLVVNSEKPKNSLTRYFGKTPKRRKISERNGIGENKTDVNLLYKVHFEGDEDDSDIYCKLKELRPRSRTIIDVKDLKIGQKVIVNYNPEQPHEKGYWYDFKVCEIVKKLRNSYELIGTIYLGPDAVPQNDTRVSLHDKIFAIEEVVPLNDRTEEYQELMKSQPEKRSSPLNCLTCRDDEDAPCKDCGCYLCSGKEFPEKIVLCDECNRGYHMVCLDPPITELPEEDWYCPACKRDPNDVIAPGAAKQTKKRQTKSNRDWGRGMACVGKTKTCSMPANHFGPIPGIEVGMCWRFRIQLSESGVHRPPVSGIHGRDVEGAYSIVLSGGYEDDVDYGNEFTYTGSGGRDLSGNKRTAEQSCDQTLTRENKALARNCAVKKVNEEGDDAGDEWRQGRPVRVVRSYKMLKHFPKYAPKEGIRYDGIYKVVKYYPEKGISGYRVWKYLLRRDDPTPAPWEPDAKHFSIIYPDGYLEAEAEKRALKEKNSKGRKSKKRALREINHSTDEETSPLAKKQKSDQTASDTPESAKAKTETPKSVKANSDTPKIETPSSDKPNRKVRSPKNKSQLKSPEALNTILHMFSKSPKAKSPRTGSTAGRKTALLEEEREAITADSLNTKLWGDCLDVLEKSGKKEFVEFVSSVFLCIICQEVAVSPVTTPCLHNFCMACLKQAFKSTGAHTCPCCRNNLTKYEPEPNEQLKAALRAIMAGYDAGKK